jgi:hypothetical protein
LLTQMKHRKTPKDFEFFRFMPRNAIPEMRL